MRVSTPPTMLKVKPAEELGRLIREEREKRGWSQTDLAVAVGSPKSQAQVSKWERAKERPEFSSLCRLAEAFDVDLDVFLDPVAADQVADQDVRIVGATDLGRNVVVETSARERRGPSAGQIKERSPEYGAWSMSPFAESLAYYVENALDFFRADRSKLRYDQLIARVYLIALRRRWPLDELRRLDVWRESFLERSGYEQSWDLEEDKSVLDPDDPEDWVTPGPYRGWKADDINVLKYLPKDAYTSPLEPWPPTSPDADEDIEDALGASAGPVVEGEGPDPGKKQAAGGQGDPE